MTRPYMFVENQVEGANVHDQFNPRTSAEIIISHVNEGMELAKKYRLPSRVRAFIPEHHGTMRVSFLYQKAVEQSPNGAAGVDEVGLSLSRPQAAIERDRAADAGRWLRGRGARQSARPRRINSTRSCAKSSPIASRGDQLDECPLTVADLDKVRESFVGDAARHVSSAPALSGAGAEDRNPPRASPGDWREEAKRRRRPRA